jgi:cation:H+ antiporter
MRTRKRPPPTVATTRCAGRRHDEPVPPARPLVGLINPGVAIVAICGIIIGAATVSEATDQILDRYGIEGTVFGATVVTPC